MKSQGFFLYILLLFFVIPGSAQNPCILANDYRIVVLGSSTGAGAGASPIDSSWVNRYRAYLQGINPANEVINLAVGGFVTYRIMPDAFVPPTGRPLPDTAHNMSKALYYQPDGIIINLPSNDRQYPMAEQLSNFDSLFRHANNMGVPVWICTTQPIVNSGPYQAAVKDSIIARFSPYVLDFWTVLADTNQLVKPQFAADAVHLNNSGHWILYNKAVQKNLPAQLYTPSPFPDLGLMDMSVIARNRCGDSAASIQLIYTNLGAAVSANLPFSLQIVERGSGKQSNISQNQSQGIGNCMTDTLYFLANLLAKGTYDFTLFHSYSGDSIASNDSLWLTKSFLGYPELELIDDTVCERGRALLQAQAGQDDHIRWYDVVSGGSLLASGNTYATAPLTASKTYYVEAVRGDLTFNNSLSTTRISNVNWNGAMFDILIHDTLTVDSLELKIADLGMQQVNAFYKMGSHLGFEAQAAAWGFWGSDSVLAVHADSFVTASFGTLSLMPGDTVGIYLQMHDPNARMSYRSTGQPLTVRTAELSIFCGSGVSYNFGGNYYPRQWNGRVFYSYGDRPEGECKTDRLPVVALLQQPPGLQLGADRIGCDSVLLDPGLSAGVSYKWSTGDSSSAIWAKQQGVYWVQVENACGDAIDAVFVEIDSVPSIGYDVIYTGGTSIYLDNKSLRARSYLWDFGDGTTSSAFNPIHTYATSGNYTVVLSIQNACDSLTQSTIIDLGTRNTDKSWSEISLSVFPNPTSGKFSLESATPLKGHPNFRLSDLQGRHLGRLIPSQSSENRFDFDLNKQAASLSKLPAGLYILHVQDKRSYGNSLLMKE